MVSRLCFFILVIWISDSKSFYQSRHGIMTPNNGQTGNTPLPPGNFNAIAMFPSPTNDNVVANDNDESINSSNRTEIQVTTAVPLSVIDMSSSDIAVESTTSADVIETVASVGGTVIKIVFPSSINIFVNMTNSGQPMIPAAVDVPNIGSTVVEIPTVDSTVGMSTADSSTVEISTLSGTVEMSTISTTAEVSTTSSSVEISTVEVTDKITETDDLTTVGGTPEVSTTEIITQTSVDLDTTLAMSTDDSTVEPSTAESTDAESPTVDNNVEISVTNIPLEILTPDSTLEMSTVDSTVEVLMTDSTIEILTTESIVHMSAVDVDTETTESTVEMSSADSTVEMSTVDSTVEVLMTESTIEILTTEGTVHMSAVDVDTETTESTVEMSSADSTVEMPTVDVTIDSRITNSTVEMSTIEIAVEILTENSTDTESSTLTAPNVHESSTEALRHIQINIDLSDNTLNANFGSTTQPYVENLGQLQNKMIHKEKCNEYYSNSKVVHEKTKVQTFIVGGTNSMPKEFPHMAALGYGKGPKLEWLCGGSLISESFVITAAHCVTSKTLGDVQVVRLGTTLLNIETLDSEDYKIIKRTVHPDYKTGEQYNDIALLQLDHPIIFSEFISPICLYSSTLAHEVLIATGWGKTDPAGDTSKELKKVELEYFPNSECQNSYSTVSKQDLPRGITPETQICAGSRTEVKDTCQGDSGGPLQTEDTGRKYLVGITSFGIGCGKPGRPGVYTRVSHYIPWIEKNVWGTGR